MKINRNNYETFFVDYLEGKLDEKLVDDFIEFLQQNPDLKEELSLFENISIGNEEITFNKKEFLLKEKYDVEQVFNEAAIAALEEEIPASEKAEFEKYLSKHPEKQKETDLFKLTKLQPDESIVFSRKNKLYKKEAGRSILLWPMRVAAVFLVALSVYIYIERTSETLKPENQIAVLEKVPEKKPNTEEIKEVPVKTEKKEIEPAVKGEKQVNKKEKAKSEPVKSLRENSKGRLESEDVAMIRINDEIPSKLQSVNPSVYAGITKMELVPVKTIIPESIETFNDEILLVDIVKEKTGIEKLNFDKITKAGLSFVASISKDKFNYETNSEGKITEVKYDSRILAFSIPTKNEIDGK
ncbi:MAG TPA: hypothetical protein P5210_05680 [Draconibacterium sp.]|nr:hypothetical protein [Draconibacterium sp.]HRX11117.1 hypothetical protein [Draconibacterium sp.]